MKTALAAPPRSSMGLPLRATPRTWVAYFLLLCLVSAVCFASLADHLLDTHDAETFQDNIATSEDFSYFFLPAAQKELGSGRPAAELVKWVAYTLWGNDPGWFHLLVVAIHTLVSFLLARLGWRLGMGLGLSFAGGLLFLVNVAHFQAVHWISALDYPLALAWGIGAMLCYLGYFRSGRPGWLGGAYANLLLGTLAHLSILMAWPLCLFWAWHRGRGLSSALRHLLPFGLALLPALAFISYLTAKDTSTWQALGSYSLQNLLALLAGLGELLLWFSSRLFTTAHWLPLPVYQQQTWELWLGGGVLAGMGVLIWKRIFPGAVWAVWILGMLLPFLLLTEEIVLDMPAGPSRYLYSASAGSSFLLAWLLEGGSQWLGRYLKPWIPYTGLTALLLASSYSSLKKAEALSFYTSGRNYIALGDSGHGTEQLKRAIAHAPQLIPLQDAYGRLGLQLMGTDELAPILDQALQRFPKGLNLNLFREVAQSLSPDSVVQQQARERLESLLSDRSGARRKNAEVVVFQSYANMGLNLARSGELKRAIAAYRRALEFDPGSVKVYRRLVRALLATGQVEEAEALAVWASQLDPTDPGTPYLAALSLKLQGKVDEAIAACQSALLVRPAEDLFTLLGECYEQKGEPDRAAEVYWQSLSLFPDNQWVSQRLADLSRAQGHQAGAIDSR